MAAGGAHPNLQVQPSPIRQPYTPRSLKRNRCSDCQKLDPLATSKTSHEKCIPKHEFAPTRKLVSWSKGSSVDGLTANRFSILAEPEQPPTQTEWAFDFVQPSNPARRRGKRGGKHNKLKYEARKRREAGKSDRLGDLCEKIAALCLDEPPKTSTAGVAPKAPSRNSVPRGGFNFPTDTIRHGWMPESRPNADSTSLGELKPHCSEIAPLLQSPKRYLTKIKAVPSLPETPELKCKSSSFFPLPAFLASPPSVACGATAKVTTRPGLTRGEATGKQLCVAPPMPAQKAAASTVCQAVASQAASSTSCRSPPVSHVPRPSSPPSLAQTSRPVSRPITSGKPSIMASPPTPLPITSPQAVLPTLSTSPIISTAPLPAYAPSIVPAMPFLQPSRGPPSLPARSISARDTPQPWEMPGFDNPGQTSPLSLITAPITSPYPFITPRKPSPTIRSSALFANPRSKPKPKPTVPFIPSLPKPDDIAPVSPVAQFELQEFLNMGHAIPCWCSRYSPPSCRSPSPDAVLRPRSRNQLTAVRKRKFDESATMAEMNAVSLSSSSASSHFEFEDLGSTGYDVLTPSGSDDEGVSKLHKEEGWMLVTSEDDRHMESQPLSTRAQELLSDPELLSRPASVVSYPTPPQTPILTPRNPTPTASRNSEITTRTSGPSVTNALMSPWATPAYSP